MVADTIARSSLSWEQISWAQLFRCLCQYKRYQGKRGGGKVKNLRKDQPTQSASTSTHHVTGPFPACRNIPDGERNITQDIHTSTENHRRPSRSFEQSITSPRINQRRNNSNSISSSRIRINLRNRILGLLALFQKLLKHRLRVCRAIVEENVEQS
jgi:hypothetical protein